MLAADGTFDNVTLRAIAANGQSSSSWRLPAIAGGIDIDDGGGDNIRVGDLIELSRSGIEQRCSYVVTATCAAQTITFAPATRSGSTSSIRLTQSGHCRIGGTINQVIYGAAEPTVAGTTQRHAAVTATRARASGCSPTTSTSTDEPGQPASAAASTDRVAATRRQRRRFRARGLPPHLRPRRRRQQPGRRAHERRRSPAAGGAGAAPSACSPNQIRKVNVTLAIRSGQRNAHDRGFTRTRSSRRWPCAAWPSSTGTA